MPWIGSTRNTATSSPRSSTSSASRSPSRTCAKPGSSGPNRLVNSGFPFAESDPSVSPWKPWSSETTRSRPVAARPSFTAASTASVPVLVKSTRASRSGVRASSASASSGGSGEAPSCTEPGKIELERLDQRRADARVRAPDVEHPEAAEHVEVAVALVVPEVGALAASPGAVEADRLQHARELRVDRLAPQLEALAPARRDELANAQTDRFFIAGHNLTVTTSRPFGAWPTHPDRP